MNIHVSSLFGTHPEALRFVQTPDAVFSGVFTYQDTNNINLSWAWQHYENTGNLWINCVYSGQQ